MPFAMVCAEKIAVMSKLIAVGALCGKTEPVDQNIKID